MNGDAGPALIVSHYRITGTLGAGGMGEVYAGLDETLRRRVALKAIKAERRLDPEAKARFLREARILSQLDHPNICRVYDYIDTPACDWLVLELIEGETLSTAIRRGLSSEAKLRVAQQVAAVLVATHAAGVAHRDLKPGNVMLTPGGDAKVLDFGLSATVPTSTGQNDPIDIGLSVTEGSDAAETELPRRTGPAQALNDASLFQSRDAGIKGTVGYMSPEQARGETATTASDMYSFGLLLQEMFTGRAPYDEGTDYQEALSKVQRGETRHPTGLGTDLTALLSRLKSGVPAERPTALDTAERLRWIADAPRRRVRNLAAVAVVVAMGLGAAKYTIDLARERTAAVAAREEADRRRDQAEGLIGFMLGDLRTKLTAVGRLEILDDIGKRALEYFAAVPAHALSGEELFRRSQAMHQLGQVRQARGDLDGAARAYEESLAQALDLTARNPESAEWQLALGTSQFYVGDLKRRRGDLDGALTHFRAYQDIARRLVDRDPSNVDWLLELSYGHSNVAAILSQTGDWRGAREQLELTGALQDQLVQRRPDDTALLMSRANNHNRLGIVLERLGRLPAAVEAFEKELAIYDVVSRANPRDARAMRRVGVSRQRLALALRALGRDDEAVAQLRQARDDAAALVALDSTNADWQRDYAVAGVWLGRLLLDRGSIADAKALFQAGIGTLEPRASPPTAPASARLDVARAREALAAALYAEGRLVESAREVDAAVQLLTPLLGHTATGADATHTMAVATNLRGLLWNAAGNRKQAEAAWWRSVELLQPLAERAVDYNPLDPLVRALSYLGRADDAKRWFDRLAAIGYRDRALLAAWETLAAPRLSTSPRPE